MSNSNICLWLLKVGGTREGLESREVWVSPDGGLGKKHDRLEGEQAGGGGEHREGGSCRRLWRRPLVEKQ